DDGTSATLEFAKPLQAQQPSRLQIAGVRDASPAGNEVKLAEPLKVAVARPVFTLDSVTCDGKSAHEQKVAGLPTKGADPWTINLFVRTTEQPENRTVIAGFGRADDDADAGVGRYLAKFQTGVH